jgi:gliding-associated putative ABC transporter substrate-binding component GldG
LNVESNAPMNQRVTQLLIVVGIVIFVNIISVRVFTRLDLTSSRAFTLSEASKNLVRSLDDKFLVKAYFTSELPSPYNNHRRYVQDQLDDFRAYGGGNFEYEFIDPSKNPEIEEEAQRYGVPPVQVQVIKDDKFQAEKAYLGLVFLYGDKQERLPVVQALDKLEYDIAINVKKLTATKLPKIGFLTGHDEPGLEKMEDFRQILSQQYEVTTVSLAGGANIPGDVVALVIVAPKKSFSDWEKYLIDQYVMRGGRVAFLLDMVDANLQNQVGRPVETGLNEVLESYGARINADLVRDTRCANITVSQQQGFIMFQSQIPYPYLPLASEYDQNNVLVKDLPPVMFYFVSSIDTTPVRQPGAKVNVLLTTSKQSGRQEGGFFMVNPTMQFTKDMFTDEHLPLAVTIEGPVKSRYADREAIIDSSVQNAIDVSQTIRETPHARIVIVGDGGFVQRETMGSRENLAFASALVDWLVDDVGLTTIRSRNLAAKPLEEVSEGTKTTVKSIILAGPPLVVIVAGIVRWRLRVAWKKRLQMST